MKIVKPTNALARPLADALIRPYHTAREIEDREVRTLMFTTFGLTFVVGVVLGICILTAADVAGWLQ